MVVQLAKPRDIDPRQGPLYQPTPQPMAPQEKSAAQQITDMAANKAMTSTVDKGASLVNEYGIQPATDAISGMFSSAAPVAAEATIGSTGLGAATVLPEVAAAAAPTSLMTTLGTAMPYVGAAMLAGKAFGLFSEGGKVNPMYANMGGLMPMLMDKAKEEGIPMGLASMLSKGGRAGPLYAADGSPTKGARVDSAGNPYNAASMYRNYQETNSSVQDEIEMLMKKYNISAKKAATIISEGAGSTLNEYKDTMLMAEVMDGPGRSLEDTVYKYGGGMAGPLSKVEYKSAGGETYKLSYGGPISKGV